MTLTDIELGAIVGLTLAVMVQLVQLREKIDALAKGQASQGARQQGRNSTQAKVIPDQEKPRRDFRHFHRGRPSYTASFPAQECSYAKIGDGYGCIWRDWNLSYGDNWGTIEANSRRYS